METIPDRIGETILIEGDEARHALRVKRVRAGEHVELMDGRGTVAAGVVADAPGAAASAPGKRHGKDDLYVRIENMRRIEPTHPRVEVWSAAPKGSRIDEMIDQLSQVGAAEWRPLETARGVVDPRETKLERLTRIAAEAGKQCGRAWTLTIGPRATFDDAIRATPGVSIIIADASGAPWNPQLPPDIKAIRLMIGPEGGWTPEELEKARSAAATIARFGLHVMRIETAAAIACGILLAR
jgi:16S rRNA (uracil1498-N3)-methyltransferase